MDTTKFIERATRVHNNLYDYSEVQYVRAKTKVVISCHACGHKWKILPYNHLDGRGCKKCQYLKLPQNQPMSHESYVKLVKKIHGDKFEYVTEYKSYKKKIQIKCKACRFIFNQRADSHLSGRGCRKCQYKNLPQNQPIDVKIFEKECHKIHENKYQYFQDYRGGRYKIKIFCKKHKRCFCQNADAHRLKKQGCPQCSSSKGEIKVRKFLNDNGIKHIPQKKFSDCKKILELIFDFFLPDFNICIEYDGEHHYKPIPYFGGKSRLQEIQESDEIKTKYCVDNGIVILRIPYFQYNAIEAILQEKLRC